VQEGGVTGQPEPYVRVYYSILEDERFATIYLNDHHLAWWLRLLLTADAMYPAPAPIPRRVNPRSLTALVDCGLVELVSGDCYRIHGLQAERERRSYQGIAGASARWGGRNANALPTQSERNANGVRPGNANGMLAEPSLDEPSQTEPLRAHARGRGGAMRSLKEALGPFESIVGGGKP
jgi:hypothetical protein